MSEEKVNKLNYNSSGISKNELRDALLKISSNGYQIADVNVIGDKETISNKQQSRVEIVNMYQKDIVEHLVNQLIKLQNTYTDTYVRNNYVDKEQIYKAMEKINKSLEYALRINLKL